MQGFCLPLQDLRDIIERNYAVAAEDVGPYLVCLMEENVAVSLPGWTFEKIYMVASGTSGAPQRNDSS